MSDQKFVTKALNARAREFATELLELPYRQRTAILRSMAKRAGLKAEFSELATPADQSLPHLPKAAPELWSARSRRDGEVSIDFLRRAYRLWLAPQQGGDAVTPSFCISDVRELDGPLYAALIAWKANNEPPADLRSFFTSNRNRTTGQAAQELAGLNIVEPSDAYRLFPGGSNRRKAARLYSAARRIKLDPTT